MNVTTFGMGLPAVYWGANLLIEFVLPSKFSDPSDKNDWKMRNICMCDVVNYADDSLLFML